ncbi:MAG: CDP-alcohol phosphatidyltransferase family protein [Candidatus Acidiferrales bacterium]
MLTRTIGRYLQWPVERLAALLSPTGIPPNVITWSALVLNLWAGILFAAGRFAAAGGLMILSGLCDLLDGRVARLQNRVSLFGGFLDSILDRYADLILFLGLLIYYAHVNRFTYAMLAGAAAAGAVMVSYAKARAESLVPSMEVGFWDRPERLVLLIIGALGNRMPLALWILAIGPNITVIHRIVHTWQQTKDRGSEPSSPHSASSGAQHSMDHHAGQARSIPGTNPVLTRTAGRGR